MYEHLTELQKVITALCWKHVGKIQSCNVSSFETSIAQHHIHEVLSSMMPVRSCSYPVTRSLGNNFTAFHTKLISVELLISGIHLP
jgi:hypothetical protein